VPEVRGIACLRHDLAAVAMTTRGELPHRPTTGLGLRERVNGASTPARLLELQGEVKRAYLEDDRVGGADVSVSSAGDGSGVTVIRANVSARPVGGEPIPVTVRL
jgi:phage baseplate assembly protein W